MSLPYGPIKRGRAALPKNGPKFVPGTLVGRAGSPGSTAKGCPPRKQVSWRPGARTLPGHFSLTSSQQTAPARPLPTALTWPSPAYTGWCWAGRRFRAHQESQLGAMTPPKWPRVQMASQKKCLQTFEGAKSYPD